MYVLFFFFLGCECFILRSKECEVFPGSSVVKNTSPKQQMWIGPLGLEDLLEKEMATHSSILAWRIPGMEEPGGLPSMGSHRVGHD